MIKNPFLGKQSRNQSSSSGVHGGAHPPQTTKHQTYKTLANQVHDQQLAAQQKPKLQIQISQKLQGSSNPTSQPLTCRNQQQSTQSSAVTGVLLRPKVSVSSAYQEQNTNPNMMGGPKKSQTHLADDNSNLNTRRGSQKQRVASTLSSTTTTHQQSSLKKPQLNFMATTQTSLGLSQSGRTKDHPKPKPPLKPALGVQTQSSTSGLSRLKSDVRLQQQIID